MKTLAVQAVPDRLLSKNRLMLWLFAGTMLSLLAILGYLLLVRYQHAVNMAEVETRNLASVIVSRVEADFTYADSVLVFLAGDLKPGQLNRAAVAANQLELSRRLAGLIRKNVNIAVLNVFAPDGQLLYSSSPKTLPFSMADRPFFPLIHDDPAVEKFFTDVLVSRSTGRLALVQIRPIRDQTQRLLGFLSAVMNLDSFDALLGNIDVGAGAVTVLRRTDNSKLVLRYPRAGEADLNQQQAADHPVRQRLKAGEMAGTLTYTASSDGIQRIASFIRLQDYPFYVQVGQARMHYLSSWLGELRWALAISGLLILIFLFAIRRMLKTEEELSATTRHLQESAQRTELAMLGGDLGMWDWEVSSGKVVFNDRWCSMLGYRMEEIKPHVESWSTLVHPDDQAQINAVLEPHLQGKTSHYECEHRMRHQQGHWVWILDRGLVVERNPAGGAVRMVGTHMDISARKAAEQALLASESRFRKFFQHNSSVMLALEPQTGVIQDANQAAVDFYGYPIEQLVGMSLDQLNTVPVEESAEKRQQMRRGERSTFTFAQRLLAGELRNVEVHSTPIEVADSAQLLLIIHDITEINQLTIERAELLQRLQKIASRIPGMVYQYRLCSDGRSCFPFASNAIRDIYRVSPESVSRDASAIFAVLHPDDHDGIAASIQQSAADLTPWHLEYRVKFGDGTVRWLSGNAMPEREADGSTLWHGFISDVTERMLALQALKASEESLRLSEAQMALSQQLGGTGSWVYFIESNQIHAPQASMAMFGFPAIDGDCPLEQFLARVSERERVAETFARALREEQAYEDEYEIHPADGSPARVIHAIGRPEKDSEGKLARVVGFIQDISERRQVEAELQRSNSELEQFSYSISHDMRQPLRMISSYLQLLQPSLGDTLNAEQREYIHFAVDGAKRLDNMLLGLLEYSRVGRKGEPPAWIDSRSVLEEAQLFLQPLVAEAQARITIEGDWPRLYASPDEMLRLVQNLLGNALKFRVRGRAPEIRIYGETKGNKWQLSLSDNGVGILPDQIGRLFQVFQRLQSRAAYEGTGIGLALCRKIVEHHGGRIWAESTGQDRGSRFVVELLLRQPEALR